MRPYSLTNETWQRPPTRARARWPVERPAGPAQRPHTRQRSRAGRTLPLPLPTRSGPVENSPTGGGLTAAKRRRPGGRPVHVLVAGKTAPSRRCAERVSDPRANPSGACGGASRLARGSQAAAPTLARLRRPPPSSAEAAPLAPRRGGRRVSGAAFFGWATSVPHNRPPSSWQHRDNLPAGRNDARWPPPAATLFRPVTRRSGIDFEPRP